MTGPAWLVLPTFNEAENLETVVSAARRVLGQVAPEGFRVLVVDDESPDGTGAMADELAAAHPGEVEVLHRPVREGLGPGVPGGLRARARGRRRATSSRWTPTSRTTRRTSRACSPPCAMTARISRWARATCPGARSPTGASSGAS